MQLRRFTFLFLSALSLASYANACSVNEDSQGNLTYRQCPKEVEPFLHRAVMCDHWAGEFGGDGSARDREINKNLEKLKCDQVDADKARLLANFKNDKTVGATIDQVLTVRSGE